MVLKGEARKKYQREYMRSYWPLYRKRFPEKVREKQRKYGNRPKTVYTLCKRQAAKRGIEFRLSFEEYERITKEPCFYCGDPGSNRIGRNGIDRKQNEGVYELANSVSCCGMCNTMKRTYSLEVFLSKCHQIVENRKRMEISH